MGKGHKQTREPALPPATLAECGPLLESALKLMDEAVPEFLPAAQQAAARKKNLDAAAKKCRRVIESNPEGLDLSAAHLALGKILEKAGDAKGAAASFALAGRGPAAAAENGDAAVAASSDSAAAAPSSAPPKDDNATAAVDQQPAANSSKKKKKKKKKGGGGGGQAGGDEEEELDEETLLEAAIAESAALRLQTEAEESARYRWVDPLPANFAEAFAEMGVEPGAELTAADLEGIGVEGGPQVAIECGLIERVE